MESGTIPQPILYTVISALCLVICYLFKLGVAHHNKTVVEMREVQRLLIVANEKLSETVDDNTKTAAQVVMMMFFLPKEFREEAQTTIRKIESRMTQ